MCGDVLLGQVTSEVTEVTESEDADGAKIIKKTIKRTVVSSAPQPSGSSQLLLLLLVCPPLNPPVVVNYYR